MDDDRTSIAIAGHQPPVSGEPGVATPDTESGAQTRTAAAGRHGRLRPRLMRLLAIVVILAVFGFIFPRMASYSAAWDVVRAMSANWILGLSGITVLNLRSISRYGSGCDARATL